MTQDRDLWGLPRLADQITAFQKEVRERLERIELWVGRVEYRLSLLENGQTTLLGMLASPGVSNESTSSSTDSVPVRHDPVLSRTPQSIGDGGERVPGHEAASENDPKP